MPKLPSAVNVLAYARSSHSGGGMARASLDDEDVWEDDFQTPHSPVHHIVRWNGGGHGEPAMERLETSGGSPNWQSFVQVDDSEEELETLEDIDPHWRAMCWLQVAVQGIAKEEVPWYELVTPMTSGMEGAALSMAKCLLAAWRWNIKVCGEDDCPPARTILNIGRFMTDEEMAGGVGEPHWFVAYSCTLQWVGEVAQRRKWEWPWGEALEVRASPLVCIFWHKTGTDLTVASLKLCWEPAPRALYCQRESSPTAHVITYLDKEAVHIPSLDVWDQLVWPTAVAIPHALTEAELYGYCRDQVVDLDPVLPVAQFWVMEEGGAYLCTVRALVFKGSVLVYNPTMNEVEWVPVRGLANDLSWAKERSAVALVNYVPHVPAEVAQIARLGASQIVSSPGKNSMSEEEEVQHPNPLTTDTDPDWEDESEDGAGQTDPKEEVEPSRWQHTWDWEAIMEGAEGLAYDDLWSDVDATITGVDGPQGPALSLHDEAANPPPHTLRCAALHMLGSPMDHMLPLEAAITSGDIIKVHVDEAELDNP